MTTKPTDLELMLYADGELDGERLAEVEAFVARDHGARAKLAALGLVSTVVREEALAAAGAADGIADAVMDLIDAEPARAAPRADAPAQPERRAEEGAAPSRPHPKAANDNARSFFMIAAVAVAAAASVMVWSRTPPPNPPASVARVAEAEVDTDHGVVVKSVDFGDNGGAIFYVPIEATPESPTTTVVWLSDGPAAEDQ
jgi:negative regulator of sigma E activity